MRAQLADVCKCVLAPPLVITLEIWGIRVRVRDAPSNKLQALNIYSIGYNNTAHNYHRKGPQLAALNFSLRPSHSTNLHNVSTTHNA